MINAVILVTGAPRSGTTPVGRILSTIPGAVDLYEPMGPTGDRRFSRRFPMPDEDGWTSERFRAFVQDLAALRLRFKPQDRGGRGFAAALTRLTGTRSLMSYRIARLTPGKRLLIWKDPHAIFWAPLGSAAGFRTVVTIRPPHAHAASFKRLGWVSRVSEIYPRYRSAFGPIVEIEETIDRIGHTPVGSASILWRIIHEQLVRKRADGNLYLLNMQAVAQDEIGAYERLFRWLGEPMPERARRTVVMRSRSTGRGKPAGGRVHDWNRSAAQANAYWREILDADDSALVEMVNGELWQQLASGSPVS